LLEKQTPAAGRSLLFIVVLLSEARMVNKKLMLLSVGYGKGHHSAAGALAEYYRLCGWEAQIFDVCELAHPVWFGATQRFYDCCVRFLPWLWRVTYDLTDTADWRALVKTPPLKGVVNYLKQLLDTYRPDLIICTYPLFAYMLDELFAQTTLRVPYAVVVTDAREISRPWARSEAELVIVPDAGSRRMLIDRYALGENRVVVGGFPVCSRFHADAGRPGPARSDLRILYGAYRHIRGVENDIRALFAAFTDLRLTVLAGHKANALRRMFRAYVESGRLLILRETDKMADYMRRSHFYIGKAGAATMFECYASHVPAIVNFTLPGQEQGNLELLMEEGCGVHVESTQHLIATLERLLADDARGWSELCTAMKQNDRTAASQRIADIIEKVFCV
jgi:processive 1,2-diacylglycerol beta-glucosyltransferase